MPLTHLDAESAGVRVTNTNATIAETGSTAQVVLRLTARPTDDVAVTVASSDATEATVFPATVTFPAASWDAPKIVTVTGVNDDIADGNLPVSVSFESVTSADPAFEGLLVDGTTFLNLEIGRAHV